MLRALLYAYVLGGLTFIPLVIAAVFFITIYTSVPVGDADLAKRTRGRFESSTAHEEDSDAESKTDNATQESSNTTTTGTNDLPKTRKGWLTMRRTFEESAGDGGYVTLVRSFLDSRSKDPKRSRPKDMWYVVLKGKVLYLYEDEGMTECEAAVELGSHRVVVYPEGLPDGELFAKRNALCLIPRAAAEGGMPSVTRQMQLEKEREKEEEGVEKTSKDAAADVEKSREAAAAARDEAMDPTTPWFIFVRSNVEMEDWYFALLHASEHPSQVPTLAPLSAIFDPAHMSELIATLDEQPDVIPMRWLNALLGRIFLSHYRTHNLEAYIIGRLMKKLSKVKRPAFLTEIAVTQVSVGNKAPMLSKPMLKELTREGDAAIEVHMKYKGEVRITVEATAVINLGARFKSYTVKLQLAAVLRELEGNLLIKVKRPPSNRIWYAFTQTPRMVLEVEPIVSDRQITWGMILGTIESKFKEIIQESVVMPNMDDIAFFETGIYEHRGGIFSDTCRKPPRDSADASENSNSTSSSPPPMADDAQSIASAPLPDITTTTTTNNPTTTTTTNTTTSSTTSSDPDPSSLVVNPTVTRSATDVLDASEERIARRRTWFSGAKSEDMSASPPVMEPSNTISDDSSRGRTLEPEQMSSSSSSNSMRSRSTPKPTSGSGRDKTPERKDGGLLPAAVVTEGSSASTSGGGGLHPPYGHGHGSRRASVSSQLSKKSGGSELGIGIGSSLSTPNTPRKSSAPDSTQTNANTNTSAAGLSASPPGSSFFSTLKSKAAAADKQAISNSAKEALRKWGANWGGFNKKETSSDEGQGQSSSGSGSGSGAGSLYPGGSEGGSTSNFLNKARASYAEVRAAVNERKERSYLDAGFEGQAQGEAGSSSSTLTSTSRPTSPVMARTRVTSTSSKPILPNGSVYSETPVNPSIVTSAARAGTGVGVGPRLAPNKSTPSLGRVSIETPEGLEGLSAGAAEVTGQKHAPIHVQPVAKTMSIPGIHASHRGDVQSLGYVAPQQTSSNSNNSSSSSAAVASGSGQQHDQQNALGSGSGGASEGMMKNPAIQTVYRLWKNPAASSSSTPATATASSSSAADAAIVEGATVVAADMTQDGQSATHAVPTVVIQQPVLKPGPPPPLPPRTVQPSATSTTSPSTGTAEEALKTIAARMEESSRGLQSPPSTPPRVSGSGSGEGSGDGESGSGSRLEAVKVVGPALPPRRVQTPA